MRVLVALEKAYPWSYNCLGLQLPSQLRYTSTETETIAAKLGDALKAATMTCLSSARAKIRKIKVHHDVQDRKDLICADPRIWRSRMRNPVEPHKPCSRNVKAWFENAGSIEIACCFGRTRKSSAHQSYRTSSSNSLTSKSTTLELDRLIYFP